MLFYTVFWSLVGVSVERYIAVTRPLHYPSILTPRRGAQIVAFIWISSFMYELIICVYNDFTVYYDYPTDMCWTLSTTGNSFAIILSLFICMIIPFVIIVLLYGRILRIARRQAALIASIRVISGKHKVKKKDTKAAMTFFIITAGFAAGSAPGYIDRLLRIFIRLSYAWVCTVLYTNFGIVQQLVEWRHILSAK